MPQRKISPSSQVMSPTDYTQHPQLQAPDEAVLPAPELHFQAVPYLHVLHLQEYCSR